MVARTGQPRWQGWSEKRDDRQRKGDHEDGVEKDKGDGNRWRNRGIGTD